MAGGEYDSSITRVRSFFCELLARDSSGESWLPRLLGLAPRVGEVLPADTVRRPGQLQTEALKPKQVGSVVLPGCFETSVQPPVGFLRWLIDNPSALTWPQVAGVPVTFGPSTQSRREEWFVGSPAARAAAMDALDNYGAAGSRRKWWAFEGFTSVDCCLKTERLTLLVEGKRTEGLSQSTAWFPERNQLARNLEVAAEAGADHPTYVMLITEGDDGPDLTADQLSASTPHLDENGRARLLGRYLGRCTWSELCSELDVGPLPDTATAAESAGLCAAVTSGVAAT